MKEYPLVSLVISTHNRKKKLLRLLNSIRNCNYSKDRIETIIIDDASDDGTHETVKQLYPKANVFRNNFELLPSRSRNIGIRNSHGDVIFIIDDDNILEKNAIDKLVNTFKLSKSVGLVGPVILYYRKRSFIWCAGGKINAPLFIHTHLFQNCGIECIEGKKLIEVDYIPNAFMLKRETINDVGFFDTQFPIGWEEVDLAMRVKKGGYKVVVQTKSKVFHDVPTTQDVHVTENRAYWRGRSRVLFYGKHSPARFLFLLLDIIGFGVLLAKIGGNHKHFRKYILGVSIALKELFNKKPIESKPK